MDNSMMNLDIALEYLNNGRLIDNLTLLGEITTREVDNFDLLIESSVINEKMDVKEFGKKAIEFIRNFFKKIIEIIKGFIEKIKNFLSKVRDKIKSKFTKLSKEEEDHLKNINLDLQKALRESTEDPGDLYRDDEKEKVEKIVKEHKKVCLPLLTEEISLDELKKVEKYINDIEVSKRAKSDVTDDGILFLNDTHTVSTSICNGNLQSIIFGNSRLFVGGNGNTPKECIDNYCKSEVAWWKVLYANRNARDLYNFCIDTFKASSEDEHKLVDIFNKMTDYMNRLNHVMETKFNFIEKKVADYYDKNHPTTAEGDRCTYTLLQNFRDTASRINSDINVLGTLVEASNQKIMDAHAIAYAVHKLAYSISKSGKWRISDDDKEYI